LNKKLQKLELNSNNEEIDKKIQTLKDDITGRQQKIDEAKNEKKKIVYTEEQKKNINDIEWKFVNVFGMPKIYKGTSVFKNYTEEESDINETRPYEDVAIQENFFTKEKYREDGKTKRYYVFFTSGSTEINKQEDIDKIAYSIQERKMNKNAIINIRIIGQASHKWLTKKSNEHGKKLNEELANKRADIVKETLFNKLLERHITHNEIDSTINIETMVSIADYDTANEIENNANLANLRSVIVEINTQ
jgi:hypothetical protein